ncbi:MAG: DUF4190 domain-containing protein [Erysipelotrichaceae bacterium]|nr:DUF4190 domain-containing protein [Erysipelotrichaceae bacterium]
MKYCVNCGKEISEDSVYCPNCGAVQQEGMVAQTNTVVVTTATNMNCVAGLILSCLSIFFNLFGVIGIMGIIFSNKGIEECKQRNENGEVLGSIGKVIGICTTILFVLGLIFSVSILSWY